MNINNLCWLLLFCNLIVASEQSLSLEYNKENKPNYYVKNGILIIELSSKNGPIYYVLPNSFSSTSGFQAMKIEHKINEESEIEKPEIIIFPCINCPKL